MTTMPEGQKPTKKNLMVKGSDENDRKTNGTCKEDDRSTTCARKMKSGAFPFLPATLRMKMCNSVIVYALIIC